MAKIRKLFDLKKIHDTVFENPFLQIQGSHLNFAPKVINTVNYGNTYDLVHFCTKVEIKLQ